MDIRKDIISINFDLKVSDLNIYYFGLTGKSYRNAYKEFGSFLHDFGFNHIQGSGYISNKKINQGFLNEMFSISCDELPWLPFCTRDIKTSRIYDLSNRYQEVMESFAAKNTFIRNKLETMYEKRIKLKHSELEI